MTHARKGRYPLGPIELKSTANDDEPAGFAEIKAAVAEVGKAAGESVAELRKRLDAMEAKANRTALTGGGNGEPNPAEERKALAAFIRSGSETDLKAMSVGNDTDGGYLVTPVRSTMMQRRLRDLSPMRRLARVVTMTAGDTFEEILDLDESGAAWVGETEGRPETDTPQLGVMRIPLNESYALQKVTQRLLDDVGFDLGGWVDEKVAEKFARQEGQAFVNGDGVRKPQGLLTYPTSAAGDATRPWGTFQHYATGNASDLASTAAADVLRKVVWGVKAPYRANGRWAMNSATANRLDTLKDGQGNYLWRAGMTAGAPPSLLGYPVEIDEEFPDIGADALPIAFGDFAQAYVIVDRPGIRSLRDPYTQKPHVLFYAYRRVGGAAGNTEALKFVKVAAS